MGVGHVPREEGEADAGRGGDVAQRRFHFFFSFCWVTPSLCFVTSLSLGVQYDTYLLTIPKN